MVGWSGVGAGGNCRVVLVIRAQGTGREGGIGRLGLGVG